MDRLPKCEANFSALTPLTFLQRAASAYSDRPSIIYGRRTSFTWKQTYDRCLRLSSSLRVMLNISKNDVVSVLAPNIPALYEMHFAVPMAGAVLNPINRLLDATAIATILAHAEPKVFFIDYEFTKVARDALKQMDSSNVPLPLVVMIDDLDCPTGARFGELEYEALVASGNPNHTPCLPSDEWDPITLNYTSGTTAAPKGVVYSHRGAYLSALTLLLQWGVKDEPVYLWSLPMFHCNGWTFTWGMAARGGTNICIRNPSAAEMYRAIEEHGVTHMCAAPVLFTVLLGAGPKEYRPLRSTVEVLTGGAPPPAPLLEKIEGLGFHVTHAYGMTEATGPALVCEWQSKWNTRSKSERSKIKSRQGLSVLTLADVDVVNNSTAMESVPRDGISMGEIVLRGSGIMKGYYKNEVDTKTAFKNGWFFTGDAAVVHADGYVEIKDRLKDVIISGGENISSVEVEAALQKHEMVAEVAVVGMPHPRWGETPCAFVRLKDSGTVSEEDLIEFCRGNLSGFMAPKKVAFVKEIPRNALGKALKTVLREMAKGLELTVSEGKKKKGSNGRTRNNRNALNMEQQVLALSRL